MRPRSFAAIGLLGVALQAWCNPAHQQIQAMPEAKRQQFFAAYLSSAGEKCPAVTKAFYQGRDSSGAVFWNVQCNPGEAWSVMIKNDAGGSGRYVSCAVMKAVNAGTCFRPFK